ncbi:MAG: arginyltransferase [Desulfobacterales bacterium]|nr:arginyltransferase [Desulfobacterales bacterium]MBF0395222.1 arginyltransferase [Desulfobacterales bacterium]
MEIKQYISQNQCSYFNTKTQINIFFTVPKLNPAIYEMLINKGYRRSGIIFYKNICPDCNGCMPIRVSTQNFSPSNSQKRVFKKNQNIKIVCENVKFDEEAFELYKKYCNYRHSSEKDKSVYIEFLIKSPIITQMMRYYVDEKLVGTGWIDILPDSVSSVYFIFDPDYSKRSLGVFSVLKEIELAKKLNKSWLQLGFWIHDNQKMSYKNLYKPHQLLINDVWQ